jgi:hypothetical protein
MAKRYYSILRIHKDDLREEFVNDKIALKLIDKMSQIEMKTFADRVGQLCCETNLLSNTIKEYIAIKKSQRYKKR